jgi:hypothetical protein
MLLSRGNRNNMLAGSTLCSILIPVHTIYDLAASILKRLPEHRNETGMGLSIGALYFGHFEPGANSEWILSPSFVPHSTTVSRDECRGSIAWFNWRRSEFLIAFCTGDKVEMLQGYCIGPLQLGCTSTLIRLLLHPFIPYVQIGWGFPLRRQLVESIFPRIVQAAKWVK